jgi:DNA-3-methyladenine glycosylase II
MSFAAQHIRDARNHLRKSDPRMRDVIQTVGPFTARTHRDRFQALARAIVSQQISGKAATSIWNKLADSLDGEVTAVGLTGRTVDQLRECGVSNQKANYILDLAKHVDDGRLILSQMGRSSDEAVIESLTQVKGIGRWTAQMFLIFSLGRLDVLPVDDLGIRTAVMRMHNLKDLPKSSQMEELATPWRPYASIASWYLWQWLDNE